MIRLVNGFEIKYNEDFDAFFQDLLEAVISESKKTALEKFSSAPEGKNENDFFLQEVMDNCIYVTHQLFEIYKENEKMTKFIITGFLFNSVVLLAPHRKNSVKKEDAGETFH